MAVEGVGYFTDASTKIVDIAFDSDGTYRYGLSKIVLGIDGEFDGYVAASNPMPMGANTAADGSGDELRPLVDADGHLQIDVLSAPTTTVSGTVAATQSGAWDIGTVTAVTSITNTVTVQGTVTANAGTGTFAISAASLPLPSGAATAAKQPSLGTAGTASSDVITVQGIASMTALVVDGSGVTQPVSAASLPLPTGASTAAKQPALGTAGSASSDVITVQGIASMTPILADVTGQGDVPITLDGETVTVTATDLDIRDIAATSDSVSAALDSSRIMAGTTAMTPKFAVISAASATDNEIVAAVASKKIRVLSYALVCAAANTVTWKSATAGNISGSMSFAANGGISAPENKYGHFQTTAGEALELTLSAAEQVSGHLTYVEAD